MGEAMEYSYNSDEELKKKKNRISDKVWGMTSRFGV